ncbi:hypothetical protein [Streptomyces roseolus]|uniref:hypothetical protein n=1 Tax=Streptomyces roseolus TaxID=67358 RepID=UPI003639CC1B
MLGIVSAVLFSIAFVVNAADIATNDVFSSTNITLLGLIALALHLAGVGGDRSGHASRRRSWSRS